MIGMSKSKKSKSISQKQINQYSLSTMIQSLDKAQIIIKKKIADESVTISDLSQVARMAATLMEATKRADMEDGDMTTLNLNDRLNQKDA